MPMRRRGHSDRSAQSSHLSAASVSTAVLAPDEIAAPIRQIEGKQKNLTIMLAEVTALDLDSNRLPSSHSWL
jgi:NADH dehydrogenase FAD-containing subunit